MSEISYNSGWIKDENGDKFAPVTTSNQVITLDGLLTDKLTLLDSAIESVKSAIDSKPSTDTNTTYTISSSEGWVELTGSDGSVSKAAFVNIDNALLEYSYNPVANNVITDKFNEIEETLELVSNYQLETYYINTFSLGLRLSSSAISTYAGASTGDNDNSSGFITVIDTSDGDSHFIGVDSISYVNGLQAALDAKSPISHTHSYAGSSSAGGSAKSAVKLDSSAGSATQPVYFKDGVPTAISYTIEKSVPSNAVFTDTNTKMTQTLSTTSANYPLLLAPSGQAATTTTTGYFGTKFQANPSTGTLTATTFSGALRGNASTATKLETARTINGTSFNGTGNITTANWGTARTIKIGSTGKSVNGSANVTWTLAEIGAAAASHSHSNLSNSIAATNENVSNILSILDDFYFEDYSGASRKPVSSAKTAGTKVGYMAAKGRESDGQLYITVQGQYSDRSTGTFSTANFLATSSDIRLKTNIKPTIKEALPFIKQIKMRQFDWIKTGFHQELGFVADELEELDSNLTVGGGYDENGLMNVKQIDLLNLSTYIVKSIQEISDADSDRDKKITSLEKENEKLKNELASIKQQLISLGGVA